MGKGESDDKRYGNFSQKYFGWIGISKIAEHHSISPADLHAALAGKTVAIVGNSRALTGQRLGPEIDAADIVIRINRAPMPSNASHGTRTDWLALAVTLPTRDFDQIRPGRILWMSHKRKRLRRWMIATEGFYAHPVAEHRTLANALTSPPTTGLMVIGLVAKSAALSVGLYGFDFFASQSLTGSRSAAQVPHDFAAEKAWVENLMVTDKRISLH